MEPIFTRSWQRNSTECPLIRLSRLREALGSSLNCPAVTGQEALRLCERREQELTGRLCISLTPKGLWHVTYTEEPTPVS